MAIQHISQKRYVMCGTNWRDGLKDVKAGIESADALIHYFA